MSARVDSPILPNFSRRLSERTLRSISEQPSPTCLQTFLDSPSPTQPQTFFDSPSEASFRENSPILPQYTSARIPTAYSLSSSVRGIHSAQYDQRPFSCDSATFRPWSTISNISTATTAVEGVTFQNPARMSDFFPDDLDFFSEDASYLADWEIMPPNEQVATQPLLEQSEAELPTISREEFHYYPASAAIPEIGVVDVKKGDKLKIRRRRLQKKRGLLMVPLQKFGRKVLVRLGIKK